MDLSHLASGSMEDLRISSADKSYALRRWQEEDDGPINTRLFRNPTVESSKPSTDPATRNTSSSSVQSDSEQQSERTATQTYSALPSLVISGPTAPETSIDTSDPHVVLDSVHHHLPLDGMDDTMRGPHAFQCIFHFSGCFAQFDDYVEFFEHCSGHFKGRKPPRNVDCTHCNWSAKEGLDAWRLKLEHMAIHQLDGIKPQDGRPDHDLFKHLWRIKVIDNDQLQELTVNKTLRMKSGVYTVTQSEGHDRRRAWVERDIEEHHDE